MSVGYSNNSKLGIIAGRGSLPADVVQLVQQQGRAFVIAGINGFVDKDILTQTDDFLVDFGKVGQLVKRFKALEVEELILAGAVTRPTLRQLRPDRFAAKFLAKVSLKALGDNSLLEAVKAELSTYGFKVIGIEDLTTDLFVGVGPIGTVPLNPQQHSDLKLAIETAKALGAADKGQAVVVKDGQVLELEDEEGTDAMLDKLFHETGKLTGGMLLKAIKPQQDRHLDLPTIGAQTVEKAIQLGLTAICIEADGGLLLQRDVSIASADANGICLYGFAANHG